MSEENYNAKGILDGIQVKYGMDGKIQYKWSLVNRLKNGIFTTYFPSSEIVAIEAKYKDDELDGESIFYNKDGTIKDRKIYKEGEQVEK